MVSSNVVGEKEDFLLEVRGTPNIDGSPNMQYSQ